MAGKKSEKALKKKAKNEKFLRKMKKQAKTEAFGPKLVSLERKQNEIARVVKLKTSIMVSGFLSYLEYIELREELVRLNNLSGL